MIFVRFIKNDRYGILFLSMTIIWTWGVLAVPIALGLDFKNIATRIAYVLAGSSPSVIALMLVFLSGDRVYARSFIKRIVQLGPIGVKGMAVIFVTVPAITAASACIGFLFSSESPDMSELGVRLKDPVGFVMFAAFTLVFGPLAEEIGWRGYLLDRLKSRGPLVYGAGIGLVWTLWHLSMFFIAGTYQNALLEQGLIPVLCFILSTTALGVIIGELARKYNSILSAILFHFMINFTGELMPLEQMAELVKTAAFAVIASVIICKYYHLGKGVFYENGKFERAQTTN